jgi:hypothetical protein
LKGGKLSGQFKKPFKTQNPRRETGKMVKGWKMG